MIVDYAGGVVKGADAFHNILQSGILVTFIGVVTSQLMLLCIFYTLRLFVHWTLIYICLKWGIFIQFNLYYIKIQKRSQSVG